MQMTAARDTQYCHGMSHTYEHHT